MSDEERDYGADGSLIDADLEGYEESEPIDEGIAELKIISAISDTVEWDDDKTSMHIVAPVIKLVLTPQTDKANAQRIYHTLWRPRAGDSERSKWEAQDKITRFLKAVGADGIAKYEDLSGMVVFGNVGQRGRRNDPTTMENFVKYFTAPPDDSY